MMVEEEGKKERLGEDEEVVRQIGKEKPEEDFKKMVAYKKEDLTDEAVEQMKRVIVQLVEDSYEGQFYKKAVECLCLLRKGCV